MIRRPPRSTQSRSSAASDVYKRQHIYSDDVQERASRPSSSSDRGRHYNAVIAGHTDWNRSSTAHQPESEERIIRRHDDAKNTAFEAFQRQPSSRKLEDRRPTSTTGSRSPATLEISNTVVTDPVRFTYISPNVVTAGHRSTEVDSLPRSSSCVPDMTRHGPEMASSASLTGCTVDVALGSSSSQTGTRSGLEERRRSVSEETTDSDVCRRSESVDCAVRDGVDKSPLSRGRSSCL